jgi:hypothetical protein
MELIEGVWRSFSATDAFLDDRGSREKLLNRFGLVRRYVTSYYRSRGDNSPFQDVRTYCMFMGHARSGGSLVGALLDAHPNVILADEVDVLKYIPTGITREQIYHLLLDRSQFQARRGRTKHGRDAKDYSYHVPGQWQGRFERMLVIGDRKAGYSTQRLGQDPGLLKDLKNILGDIQLRLIQVIRNPYDTITTMNLRSGRPLENGIGVYFSNCAVLRAFQESLPGSDWFLVKHEPFLNSPETYLKRLCAFLDIEPHADYIQSCASILYKKPAQTRQKAAWTPELIAQVRSRIDEFDFLHGYSYDGD